MELVRSIFQPSDPSRFFELLDEEVEQEGAPAATRMLEHSGAVHGKAAVISLWRRFWGAWDDYVIEPIEFNPRPKLSIRAIRPLLRVLDEEGEQKDAPAAVSTAPAPPSVACGERACGH